MTDRARSASTAGYRSPKMETELLSPRKTMLVLVIVVGCFAVLWPKVFYPMLVGSASQHIKPSPIDKTTGCCDVISETDVNTIKLMSELCGTVIKPPEGQPLTGKEMVQRCRQEVLETCGIDISVVLQEQVRLGQSVKQILDQVRSLNGSLCLKYNYGVAPWRLGVPHRITVKMASDSPNIRQERPLHLRSELIHPAFRERGRAIPQPQAAPPTRPPPRVVEGRPGPLPGMRPTLGGAGHVVPPSKQGTSSMSVIMPIYTIGIVIFFTYTLMRIIFKKQPEGVGGSLYPPVEPDPHFRKEVFESEASRLGPRLTRENISSKLVVNAMSALLDEVDQEIEARRKSSEVAAQDLVNGTLSNGDVLKPQETEEQPTVKVLGMEMTASCEGGKKWSRPDSPVLPTSPPPPPAEPAPPPQEIYLEGALPAQSHLLVANSATEPQPVTGEDPAVVLAGKMTLSVISLDGENGAEEAAAREEAIPEIKSVARLEEETEEGIQESKRVEDAEQIEDLGYEIEDYILEPLIEGRFEAPPSKTEVEDIGKKLQESTQSAVVMEEKIEDIIQKPLIQLESDDTSHTVEVEALEQEVDSLIQQAIENIQQREPTSLEILHNLNLQTNEINDNLKDVEKQIESDKIIETREEKPTLQVVPDAEKVKIEELTPQTEAIVAKEPILTNNQIKNLIEEVKESSSIIEEKSEPCSIEKFEESPKVEEISGTGSEAIETVQTIEESKQVAIPINTTEVSEEMTVGEPAEFTQIEEIKQLVKPSSPSVEKIEEQLKFEVVAPVEISERIERTTVDVVEAPKPSQVVQDSNEVGKPVETSEKIEEQTSQIAEASQRSEESEQSIKDGSEQIEEKSKRVEESSKTEEEVPKPSPTLEASQKSEERPVQISESVEKAEVEVVEAPKSSSPVVEAPKLVEALEPSSPGVEAQEKLVEIATVDVVEVTKPTSPIEVLQKTEERLVEIAAVDVVEVPTPTSPIAEILQETEEKPVEIAAVDVVELPTPTSPIAEILQETEERPVEIATVDVIEAPKPSSSIVEGEETHVQLVETVEKTKGDIVGAPTSSSPVAEVLQDREEKPVEAPQPSSPAVEVPQKFEEKCVEISETVTKAATDVVEAAKPSSPIIEAPQTPKEKPVEKAEVDVEAPKPSSPQVEGPRESEEKSKLGSKIEAVEELTDDDELGSDEELVEEIEEIVYESHDEESEEEQSEEEIAIIANRTDSGGVQRVNGERSEDLVESKYTTVSGATAAENDISDEELTDNEEVEDEEIIEVEEEIDDDYIVDESNDVNHVSGESEPEL